MFSILVIEKDIKGPYIGPSMVYYFGYKPSQNDIEFIVNDMDLTNDYIIALGDEKVTASLIRSLSNSNLDENDSLNILNCVTSILYPFR